VPQTPHPCCNLPGPSGRLPSERRARAGPGALNPTTRAAIGPDPVLAFVPNPRARALPGALNPTPALSLRFVAKPGTNERFAPSGRSVPAIPVAFCFLATLRIAQCVRNVFGLAGSGAQAVAGTQTEQLHFASQAGPTRESTEQEDL
jgi:hypothetical protein